jgi:hypothetical protein
MFNIKAAISNSVLMAASGIVFLVWTWHMMSVMEDPMGKLLSEEEVCYPQTCQWTPETYVSCDI